MDAARPRNEEFKRSREESEEVELVESRTKVPSVTVNCTYFLY
jgi:hypothetical protein